MRCHSNSYFIFMFHVSCISHFIRIHQNSFHVFLMHHPSCRILTYFVAPAIEFKHCLSVTGYSLFSWSLALLMSFPLEVYESSLGIPVMTPLVLVGLPAAVAQVQFPCTDP